MEDQITPLAESEVTPEMEALYTANQAITPLSDEDVTPELKQFQAETDPAVKLGNALVRARDKKEPLPKWTLEDFQGGFAERAQPVIEKVAKETAIADEAVAKLPDTLAGNVTAGVIKAASVANATVQRGLKDVAEIPNYITGRTTAQANAVAKSDEARQLIGDLPADKVPDLVRSIQGFQTKLDNGEEVTTGEESTGKFKFRSWSAVPLEVGMSLRQAESRLQSLKENKDDAISVDAAGAIINFADGAVPFASFGKIIVDESNPEELAKRVVLQNALADVLQKDYKVSQIAGAALGSFAGFALLGGASANTAGKVAKLADLEKDVLTSEKALKTYTDAAETASKIGSRTTFGIQGTAESFKDDSSSQGIVDRTADIIGKTASLFVSEGVGDKLEDTLKQSLKISTRAGLAGSYLAGVATKTAGETTSDTVVNVIDGKDPFEGFGTSLATNAALFLGVGVQGLRSDIRVMKIGDALKASIMETAKATPTVDVAAMQPEAQDRLTKLDAVIKTAAADAAQPADYLTRAQKLAKVNNLTLLRKNFIETSVAPAAPVVAEAVAPTAAIPEPTLTTPPVDTVTLDVPVTEYSDVQLHETLVDTQKLPASDAKTSLMATLAGEQQRRRQLFQIAQSGAPATALALAERQAAASKAQEMLAQETPEVETVPPVAEEVSLPEVVSPVGEQAPVSEPPITEEEELGFAEELQAALNETPKITVETTAEAPQVSVEPAAATPAPEPVVADTDTVPAVDEDPLSAPLMDEEPAAIEGAAKAFAELPQEKKIAGWKRVGLNPDNPESRDKAAKLDLAITRPDKVAAIMALPPREGEDSVVQQVYSPEFMAYLKYQFGVSFTPADLEVIQQAAANQALQAYRNGAINLNTEGKIPFGKLVGGFLKNDLIRFKTFREEFGIGEKLGGREDAGGTTEAPENISDTMTDEAAGPVVDAEAATEVSPINEQAAPAAESSTTVAHSLAQGIRDNTTSTSEQKAVAEMYLASKTGSPLSEAAKETLKSMGLPAVRRELGALTEQVEDTNLNAPVPRKGKSIRESVGEAESFRSNTSTEIPTLAMAEATERAKQYLSALVDSVTPDGEIPGVTAPNGRRYTLKETPDEAIAHFLEGSGSGGEASPEFLLNRALAVPQLLETLRAPDFRTVSSGGNYTLHKTYRNADGTMSLHTVVVDPLRNKIVTQFADSWANIKKDDRLQYRNIEEVYPDLLAHQAVTELNTILKGASKSLGVLPFRPEYVPLPDGKVMLTSGGKVYVDPSNAAKHLDTPAGRAYLKAAFVEEIIHRGATAGVPRDAVIQLAQSLKASGRAEKIARDYLQTTDPAKIADWLSSDFRVGHEYLRRQLQAYKGLGTTEAAVKGITENQGALHRVAVRYLERAQQFIRSVLGKVDPTERALLEKILASLSEQSKVANEASNADALDAPTPGSVVANEPLGGSTGARKLTDSNGNAWVMKYGDNEGQRKSERVANGIYAAFAKEGAPTIVPKMVSGPGEKKRIANVMPFYDLPTLGDYLEKLPATDEGTRARIELKTKLVKGLVVDALLGNWDFAGLDLDNILIDRNGNPIRVDVGGALSYRAQGEVKEWGSTPSDIFSMLAPGRPAFDLLAKESYPGTTIGEIIAKEIAEVSGIFRTRGFEAELAAQLKASGINQTDEMILRSRLSDRVDALTLSTGYIQAVLDHRKENLPKWEALQKEMAAVKVLEKGDVLFSENGHPSSLRMPIPTATPQYTDSLHGGSIEPTYKDSPQSEYAYRLVRTKTFKDFYGDWTKGNPENILLDDVTGEPIILFHASRPDADRGGYTADFTTLTPKKTDRTSSGFDATFFAVDPITSDNFGSPGWLNMPVSAGFLKTKKIWNAARPEDIRAFKNALREIPAEDFAPYEDSPFWSSGFSLLGWGNEVAVLSSDPATPGATLKRALMNSLSGKESTGMIVTFEMIEHPIFGDALKRLGYDAVKTFETRPTELTHPTRMPYTIASFSPETNYKAIQAVSFDPASENYLEAPIPSVNEMVTTATTWAKQNLTSRRGVPEPIFQAMRLKTGKANAEAALAESLLGDFQKLSKANPTSVDTASKMMRGELSVQDTQAFKAAAPEFYAVTKQMRDHVDQLSTRISELAPSDEQAQAILRNLGQYLNRSYRIFDDAKWSAGVREALGGKGTQEFTAIVNAAATFLQNDLAQTRALKHIHQYVQEQQKAGRFMALPSTRVDLLDAIVKGDPDVLNALDALQQSLRSHGGITLGGKNISSTDAEARALLFEMADFAEDDLTSYYSGGSGAGLSTPLQTLKHRKNIPVEIRNLWGEYKDINLLYPKTVFKQAALIANHEFLSTTAEALVSSGMGYATREAAVAAGHPEYVMVFPDAPRYAPVSGMYGPRELRDVLGSYASIKNNYSYATKAAMTLTGASLASKTIGSIAGGVRNFVGNVVPALNNGYLFVSPKTTLSRLWTGAKLSGNPMIEMLSSRMKADPAYVLELYKYGVIDENVSTGLITQVMGELLHPEENAVGQAKGAFEKVVKFSADWYQAYDNVWKVLGYEAELNDVRSFMPDASDEDVKMEASRRLRDCTFTYSMVPKAIKELRGGPAGIIFAPFVSFSAEVIRVGVNTAQYAWNDYHSDNAARKAVGFKRFLGIAATHGGVYAITQALQAVLGFDDKDVRALKKFLAPWAQSSSILPLRTDGKVVEYIDLSFTNPFGYFYEPWKLLAEGNATTMTEKVISAVMAPIKPFVGEQILAKVVTDLARNQDDLGKKVYHEDGSGGKVVVDIAKHLWTAFEPGTLTSAKRILKAVTGEIPNQGRAYQLGNEVASVFTGLKIASQSIPQGVSSQGFGNQRGLREGGEVLSQVLKNKGTVSESDIETAFNESETIRKTNAQRLYSAVKAARTLGLKDNEIAMGLKDAGLTNDAIGATLRGLYVVKTPTKDYLNDIVVKPDGRKRLATYIRLLQAQKPVVPLE